MKKPNVLAASVLIFLAGLHVGAAGALAQQGRAEPSAAKPEFSDADKKAIENLLKDQETAWNKHDMKAFTRWLRDDAEGINVAGMYWSGKAAIVKHLTDFHATFLKDCDEYMDEVHVHFVDEKNAVAVSVWRVSAFKGPGGEVIPACRHRDTTVLAKDAEGWKIVHFHNTTIDEPKNQAPGGTPGK